MVHENLGFVLQAAKRCGMDHPVPVPLEDRAERIFRLPKSPAPGSLAFDGVWRKAFRFLALESLPVKHDLS
jgi:hypothetical protein